MKGERMNDKKETIVLFIFIGVFVVSVLFLCAGRTSVHDLRERAAPVRTELNNAQAAQQREAETIERASEAAGRSAEAVSNSQRTAEEIQRMERDDIELIRECQSILSTVRERGSKESAH